MLPQHISWYTPASAENAEYTRPKGQRRKKPFPPPLTLEEVQKHCEEGVGATPLWMEFIGHDDLSRWMVACIPDIVFEAGNIKLHMDAFGHRYNTMWRCWPRKPTPEQMAAVEWEE